MQHLKFWFKVMALLLLWGILLPRLVHAQPGSPDPAFGGGDGFSTLSFLANGHAYPTGLAVQPNGRIVVAGGTWIPDGTENEYIAMARFMPNGSLDVTFGGGTGKVTVVPTNLYGYLAEILILPNGKILGAGGAWTHDGIEHYFMLARFNTDGTPDNSFDGDGFVTTKLSPYDQYATALALQPDGKILVAGPANISGYSEFAVLRYTSNGTLDNTFGGGDGTVTMPVGESYSSLRNLALQPDGKIVVTGFAVANGFEDFALARFKSDGAPDPSFGGGDGVAMVSVSPKNDGALEIALQTDGKIVLAGYSNSGANNYNDMAVVRFNANGTLDNTFSGDGQETAHLSDYGEDARGLVIQPDGKILLGGSRAAAPNETKKVALVRFNTNGILDNSFHNDGVATLDVGPGGGNIEEITLQPDGKVVAVGPVWDTQAQLNSFVIARFLTGVTVDTNTPETFVGRISLYPNPVRDQAALEYELSSTEEVEVNLYDMQGRVVQNLLPRTTKTPGKHAETMLFTDGLPSGTYILTIETASGRSAIEVIF